MGEPLSRLCGKLSLSACTSSVADMPLTLERALAAISAHSHGLADDARGNLSVRGEHCPDWNVADLVWHVSEVHWFWRTIAGERLSEPVDESRRPVRPADDHLLETFLSGAEELVETLRTADQSSACWTWFPPQQDVAFITRHQVQEAAVHHFDAANAAGHGIEIDPQVADDCVEEFLTTSLADADDVTRLGRTLDGELVLRSTDTKRVLTVRQEAPEAALTWQDGGRRPTVEGTSAELILWVYGRVDLPVADEDLVRRFRSLSSTD